MYIFRYTSNEPTKSCISLHQAPIGKGTVDFFPGEGVSRNTLLRDGDYTIVRVKGAQASVLVTEYHPEGVALNCLKLEIDQIDTHPQKGGPEKLAKSQSVTHPPEQPEPTACPLQLAGHVERLGDVCITGGWLGQPGTALRLEGFAISWLDQPEGVDLAYMCRTGNSEPMVGLAGQYVGTRRQARPITTVAFTLTGPKAGHYQLSGQVVFTGNPPVNILPEQELSGKHGTEQLVALNLVVTPKAAQVSPPASPWNDLKTVKIFSKR